MLLAQPTQVLEGEAGEPTERMWQRKNVCGWLDRAVDEVEVGELVKGAQFLDHVCGDAEVRQGELSQPLEQCEAAGVPDLDHQVPAGFLHGQLPLLAHEVHRTLVLG